MTDNRHLTIEEARTFSEPDATYKAVLNDPLIFEALCSDPETIAPLIELLEMKVKHLNQQLVARRRRYERDVLFQAPELVGNFAEWEPKVQALLRSTTYHLHLTLRRAHLLWDDPVKTLREIQRLIENSLDDSDVIGIVGELVNKSIASLEQNVASAAKVTLDPSTWRPASAIESP